MLIVNSKNRVPIRLTEERWQHIVESHNYMKGHKKLMRDTLTAPDCVVHAKTGEFYALKNYKMTHFGQKTQNLNGS